MPRRRNPQNRGRGWHNDRPQHSLASHGIPTTLKDSKTGNMINDDKMMDWVDTKLKNTPHKQDLRREASDWYEDIQEKLEEGELEVKDGELVETDEYFNVDQSDLLDDDILEDNEEYTIVKTDNTSFNGWLAYHSHRTLKPLKDWLYSEYGLHMNIAMRGGGERMYYYVIDPETDDGFFPPPVDVPGQSFGEYDLELREFIMENYPKWDNKREFKNEVVDWAEDKLKSTSHQIMKDIIDNIENGNINMEN